MVALLDGGEFQHSLDDVRGRGDVGHVTGTVLPLGGEGKGGQDQDAEDSLKRGAAVHTGEISKLSPTSAFSNKDESIGALPPEILSEVEAGLTAAMDLD